MQNIRDISLLVAEDEQELLDYIVEYLHLFFDKIYKASNGDEAYEIYEDKKPDIIITDINMPSLDGLDLITKIRKRDKQTRIIIMSAHSEEDKLLRAVELHLETYLIKPIKVDKLKDILFRCVNELRKTSKRVYLSENIYWDKISEKLYEKDDIISLKPKETICMRLLCKDTQKSISAKKIFNTIHKDTKKEFSADSVTSLIKRLRTKLPKGAIKNIYGEGYKIVNYNEK